MLLFISFISGVVAYHAFQYFPFCIFLLSFLVLTFLSIRKRFFPAVILIVGIIFAFFRDEPDKIIRVQEPVIVNGIFKSYPVRTSSGIFRQPFHVNSAKSLENDREFYELTGEEIILLSEKQFDIGTESELLIKFLKKKKRLNPGEYKSNKIYAKTMSVVNVRDRKFSLNSTIQEYRHEINRYIEDNFEKNPAALITSITTGHKSNLNDNFRDSFNAAGLAHILSISGTHFGLFSFFVFGIFRLFMNILPYKILQRITIFFTPSQAAAVLCFPFMLAYLGLSGASIPAIRSFIMISIFLAGLIIGRKGFWLNSVIFAALLLIIWNPQVIFQLSFQLSFIAVLCIGFSLRNNRTGERDEDKKDENRILRYFKNALLISVSASIGTAPLVAYYFHYFSVISPVSNLLIAPVIGFIVIPLSVFSSFLYLITGYFLFAPVIKVVSGLSISAVELFAGIPFADLKIPAFPPIIILLFYAGFIFYFLPGRPKNTDSNEKTNDFNGLPKQARHEEMLNQVQRDTFRIRHDGIIRGLKIVILNSFQNLYRHFWVKKRYALIIPFVPVIIYFSLSIFEKKDLTVTFLDVGQGDSSVIELPDGKTLVIDAGKTGRETASFLKYRGKQIVDAVILSHVHSDHTGGLNYLIKEFEVKELWDNGRLIIPENILANIDHRTLNRGDMTGEKDYSIYVFHPYAEFYTLYGDENAEADNDSLVFKIEGKYQSILFTGDIEEEAEDDILHLGQLLKSNVLKIPHHGSKTSAHFPFFKAVSPQIAVISAGHENPFGHPHQETIDALHGIDILQTDIEGAVKISESINGLNINTYRDFQFQRAASLKDEVRNLKRLLETW